MAYMLLIIEPVSQRRERGPEGGRDAYAQMLQFGAGLQARGVLLASNSLASTHDSVRLQVREGRPTLVDGPFAETKEMVGGFFLLDVATREEAVAIAAECPAAQWSTVEIRAVGPCYE
ncbi:YciI family protein [Rivibacter subsaxonicus]|uniref:YCII-related domain-containing protein n=1 Tax=Rivibacter subsaxonicus TaxID=457575 RepID=A0A4Q7VZU2_9BURK|nr:YciI family protein [Rivibacter subsaxonicus]RZU02320.1 hypothetical protein EV670_0343 [Rivibacter subsaxonicus]